MSHLILKPSGEVEHFSPATPYEMNVANSKGLVIPVKDAKRWYYNKYWQQRPKHRNVRVARCLTRFK